MEKNQKMLKTGSFLQLVMKMCLPAVVIMLVTVLYNMADTFFIAKTNDPAKIAAVSIAGVIFSLLSGIGTLFGTGGCTSISLFLGEGDRKKVDGAANICLIGSIAVSLIFMFIMYCFMDPICYGLGSTEETFAYTKEYLTVITAGAPFILFSNIFTNLIRGDGNTIASLIANLTGSLANIILDAIFVMVLHMNIFGVAFATVIGNVISCIYLLYYIYKKQDVFHFAIKNITFQRNILIPVLTLGLPVACSTLLMSVSHVFANQLMSSYGTVALSASSVASKIGMLISMTLMGITMGFQPAISYNYGNRNHKRLYQLLKQIAIFVVIIGSISTVLCFVFRSYLIRLFIDNAEVIAKGEIMVIADILIGPVYGLYQLCLTFLQATGKAGYATAVSVLDKGVVYIPVLFIMNTLFGEYGISFTSTVTLMISLVISVIFSLKWKKQMDTVSDQLQLQIS